MTSHVEKLAEAECASCNGLGCDTSFSMNPAEMPQGKDCPTCHGTGALVPGLWRRCIGDPLRLVDATGHSSSASCSGGCQGRGWTLIPEAEQMGVLVRVLLESLGEFIIGKFGMGAKLEQGRQGFYLYYEDFDGVIESDTPEEALPHAICQVAGV